MNTHSYAECSKYSRLDQFLNRERIWQSREFTTPSPDGTWKVFILFLAFSQRRHLQCHMSWNIEVIFTFHIASHYITNKNSKLLELNSPHQYIWNYCNINTLHNLLVGVGGRVVFFFFKFVLTIFFLFIEGWITSSSSETYLSTTSKLLAISCVYFNVRQSCVWSS